ncbi:hypothetical protein DPMN_144489 [Dreissena polymorpha]|uniref:Immunoglobulin I-set domain-containing protein n=1 Tax=Dreissena polymorpha TaxID=45954 RepID=A0A9D4GF35_DREPO|nr:hypothetical protein DPMN_144489 [Dreissena polymorpha]
MDAIGYPAPMYEWYHFGQSLKSSDQSYSSEVTIRSMQLKDHGYYKLKMNNTAGTSTYNYFHAAYGTLNFT